MTNFAKIKNLLVLIAFLVVFELPQASLAADLTITDLSAKVEGTNILISWRTSRPASGCVQFGKSRDYDLQLCAAVSFDNGHRLQLINLQEKTIYHYRVVSKDSMGQKIVSFDNIFKTGERTDSVKPEILNLNLEYVGATTVFLKWATNEPTTGKVEYGIDSSFNKSANSRSRKTKHELKLTRLELGAKYSYQITVEDKSGNKTFSSIQSFRTSIDKSIEDIPLRITQIKPVSPGDSEISETTAIISWQVTRPASGFVKYGTQPDRLNKKISSDEKKIQHSVQLENLRPDTIYYFQISAKDIFNKSNQAPQDKGAYSFKTKSRAAILGAQNLGPQPAVLTSLKQPGIRVLGAFTTIYTPAIALLKTIHSPKIYAIYNSQKHWLRTPTIFQSFGYRFEDVKIVSQIELDNLKDVKLVKLPDQSPVYYLFLNQGLKINIPSPSVFNSYKNNSWEDIITISPEDLGSFMDVQLVKTQNSPTVYLLENNRRIPFVSEEALLRFGYDQSKIVIINETHLKTFTLGGKIE